MKQTSKFGSSGSNFSRSRKPPQPEDFTPEEWDEKARNWILDRLSRSPRTRLQLLKMLSDRAVPAEISERLLDRFTEVGLIDDAAFARAFTNTRRQSRGLSKSALKRELSTAGVDAELINLALEDIDSEAELELATELAIKRIRSLASLDRDVQYRRLSGYLGRRGFASGIVSSAIRVAQQQVN